MVPPAARPDDDPRRRPATRPLPALLAVLLAGATTAGCASGFDAQTTEQTSKERADARDAADVDVGTMRLRHVHVGYAGEAHGVGATAPLYLTIFNEGTGPDRLVAVRTEAASSVVVRSVVVRSRVAGRPSPTAGGRSPSTATPTPSPPPTSSPTSAPPPARPVPSPAVTFAGLTVPAGGGVDLQPGAARRLELTGLRARVLRGASVPVTFTFAVAGAVRVDVPVQHAPR